MVNGWPLMVDQWLMYVDSSLVSVALAVGSNMAAWIPDAICLCHLEV